MRLLPYNHAMVDTFFRETDYVIHTKYGQTRVAGLFRDRESYDEEGEYVWVTAEGMKVIPGDTITHWMPINI